MRGACRRPSRGAWCRRRCGRTSQWFSAATAATAPLAVVRVPLVRAGPLGAGLSIGGLAILALVTLAPPVPAQAADAPYDPFPLRLLRRRPDYPEVSARNPKPVAGYLGGATPPFDFIEVAPAIEHCERRPWHGYFLARAYLRHGADKAFPLLIKTARQGEPASLSCWTMCN